MKFLVEVCHLWEAVRESLAPSESPWGTKPGRRSSAALRPGVPRFIDFCPKKSVKAAESERTDFRK